MTEKKAILKLVGDQLYVDMLPSQRRYPVHQEQMKEFHELTKGVVQSREPSTGVTVLNIIGPETIEDFRRGMEFPVDQVEIRPYDSIVGKSFRHPKYVLECAWLLNEPRPDKKYIVKPLVWEEDNDGGFYAYTSIGIITVVPKVTNNDVVVLYHADVNVSSGWWCSGADPEELKERAEKAFGDLLRGCLTEVEVGG